MNSSLLQLLKMISPVDDAKSCFAVDVGAHHGNFSKFLLETNCFSHILAFEPNPDSFSKASTGLMRQGRNYFSVINSALSFEEGVLDLYCDADTATASLLPYSETYQNIGMQEKYSVQVTTLDKHLAAFPLPDRLGLLKIDTQGNDLAVIRGANRTIAKHRPIIQVEFIYISLYKNQCSVEDLLKTLTALNYKMYSLNNLHVTPQGRLAFCDAIFIPGELELKYSQEFICIDDQDSCRAQLAAFEGICRDRLLVIERLEIEVQRLTIKNTSPILSKILKRIISWGR